MLFSTPDCLKAPLDIVRLWLHEASRVYADKLLDDKDMEQFNKLKFLIAKDNFDASFIFCIVYVKIQNTEFTLHFNLFE